MEKQLEQKMESGNFSKEQKQVLKYAVETKAVGIMEKDGKWVKANNWSEVQYAVSIGWRYIGHPVDVINGLR